MRAEVKVEKLSNEESLPRDASVLAALESAIIGKEVESIRAPTILEIANGPINNVVDRPVGRTGRDHHPRRARRS